MFKNEIIDTYTSLIKVVMEDAKKDGIRIAPYEVTINNIPMGDITTERGICVTDEMEYSYIPTYKLAD